MTNQIISPINLESVSTALRTLLDRSGYTQVVSAFCLEPEYDVFRRFAELEFDRNLKDLFLLFYFGGKLPAERVCELIGAPLTEGLVAAGLLPSNPDGTQYFGGLRLNLVSGLFVLAQLPTKRHSIYFGEDSLGLARRQPVLRDASAIDLCCGTGIQGLMLARNGARVTSVDLNPVALSVGEINAQLNGVEDRIEFRQGDLWSAVPEESRFDWVCANPPLLPTIKELNYPLIGAGGDDGLEVTWRILEGLPKHLSERGQCLTLGVTFSDGLLPNVTERLEQFLESNHLNGIFEIISSCPLDEREGWARHMALTYSIHEDISIEEARQMVLDQIERQKAKNAICYFLRVMRGDGSLKVIDLSALNRNSLWKIG